MAAIYKRASYVVNEKKNIFSVQPVETGFIRWMMIVGFAHQVQSISTSSLLSSFRAAAAVVVVCVGVLEHHSSSSRHIFPTQKS
jgi:hypothetical protein